MRTLDTEETSSLLGKQEEPTKAVDRMRPSIFRLALVLLAYILFTLSIGIIWSSYENSHIIKETDHYLTLASKSLKYMLAEDFHDRAIEKKSIEFPEELENRRRLNGLVNETDLTYAYTIVEKDGSFYFSAPTVTDEEARDRKSWYFYPYEDIPTEFVRAFRQREKVVLSYTDQWGTFRTVCLPEMSRNGNSYLACADINISHLDSAIMQNILVVGLILLGFILFTIPIIWSFRSFYRKYAQDLRKQNDTLLLYQENLEQLVAERTQDLYRAKDEAEEASRIKSRFVANMSHEIRTPLNAIVGIADSLSGADLPRRFTPLVTTLRSAGDLLFSLVNNILDISKLESGRLELMPNDFRLRTFIDDIRNIFLPQMRVKNLEFEITLGEGLPEYLYADATRYHQILVNLLSNAVKFTSTGSIHLRIELQEEIGDRLVLRNEVHDTGIGISEDMQPSLFELFYQGDISMRRVYGGSGIGLNLCKHLVERMGGSIEVQSRVGRGSSFIFTLQVQKSCVQTSCPDCEKKTCKEQGGLHALIAEDNLSNVTLIEFYFKDSPHKADIVKNGLDAFTRFTQSNYDIVFMDLEMPIMDGFEAVRRIREYERVNGLPETPVFALTAHATTDVMEQVMASGFNAYLTKPITRERLFDEMENASSFRGDPHAQVDEEDVSPDTRTSFSENEMDISLNMHEFQLRERLRAILPGYIVSIKKDVEELRNKLQQSDIESVRKIAHKIKGSGASFGYESLTVHAALIHDAAVTGDRVAIDKAFQDLYHFIENIGPDGSVREPI